jgi:alkaline phosphatase D
VVPRRLAVLFLLILAAAALAADPQQPLRRVAFGSCADQDKPQPIWDAVVAGKPELFLFIGDIIYADTKDMDVMRAKYNKLAGLPGYQRLLKTCPLLATWDDHDYGGNDAGTDYPKKVESQQILLDFLGEPKDSPRRKQEGIHHARVFGPPGKRTQVILLDTRYFRSALKKKEKFIPAEGGYVPNTDPDATFLGAAQWKWLEEQLRVPAELRLLVSSIQVVAEDHGHEKWMNIPAERERLFRLLADTKAGGVVILSGDRHLAELSMMDAGLGYPLYDLTASGLNQASKRWRKLETNRHRVATMNVGDHFGTVTVDWDRADPIIGLQIRDAEGDVTIGHKVPLSLLQPGALKAKPVEVAKLSTGEPLTDAEVVKKHVGKEVTVEMTVNATGASQTRTFLNSAVDRNSDENFTVVLPTAAVEAFKKAGVDSPRDHFKGKRVKVTGKLSLFREKPQIVVDDPKQIEIAGK